MAFVLDNSVVMAWCFEDEATPFTDELQERLLEESALAPPIWPLEVANALAMAERRGRIRPTETDQFIESLLTFPITVENLSLPQAVGPILALSREQQITAYDASYLELAMRRGIPLATLDTRLRAAARRLGIALVP